MEGNLWAGEDVLKGLHRLERGGGWKERGRGARTLFQDVKENTKRCFVFSGSQNYRSDRVHRNQYGLHNPDLS